MSPPGPFPQPIWFTCYWIPDGTYRALCLLCDWDGPRHPVPGPAHTDLAAHEAGEPHRRIVATFDDLYRVIDPGGTDG